MMAKKKDKFYEDDWQHMEKEKKMGTSGASFESWTSDSSTRGTTGTMDTIISILPQSDYNSGFQEQQFYNNGMGNQRSYPSEGKNHKEKGKNRDADGKKHYEGKGFWGKYRGNNNNGSVSETYYSNNYGYPTQASSGPIFAAHANPGKMLLDMLKQNTSNNTSPPLGSGVHPPPHAPPSPNYGMNPPSQAPPSPSGYHLNPPLQAPPSPNYGLNSPAQAPPSPNYGLNPPSHAPPSPSYSLHPPSQPPPSPLYDSKPPVSPPPTWYPMPPLIQPPPSPGAYDLKPPQAPPPAPGFTALQPPMQAPPSPGCDLKSTMAPPPAYPLSPPSQAPPSPLYGLESPTESSLPLDSVLDVLLSFPGGAYQNPPTHPQPIPRNQFPTTPPPAPGLELLQPTTKFVPSTPVIGLPILGLPNPGTTVSNLPVSIPTTPIAHGLTKIELLPECLGLTKLLPESKSTDIDITTTPVAPGLTKLLPESTSTKNNEKSGDTWPMYLREELLYFGMFPECKTSKEEINFPLQSLKLMDRETIDRLGVRHPPPLKDSKDPVYDNMYKPYKYSPKHGDGKNRDLTDFGERPRGKGNVEAKKGHGTWQSNTTSYPWSPEDNSGVFQSPEMINSYGWGQDDFNFGNESVGGPNQRQAEQQRRFQYDDRKIISSADEFSLADHIIRGVSVHNVFENNIACPELPTLPRFLEAVYPDGHDGNMLNAIGLESPILPNDCDRNDIIISPNTKEWVDQLRSEYSETAKGWNRDNIFYPMDDNYNTTDHILEGARRITSQSAPIDYAQQRNPLQDTRNGKPVYGRKPEHLSSTTSPTVQFPGRTNHVTAGHPQSPLGTLRPIGAMGGDNYRVNFNQDWSSKDRHGKGGKGGARKGWDNRMKHGSHFDNYNNDHYSNYMDHSY